MVSDTLAHTRGAATGIRNGADRNRQFPTQALIGGAWVDGAGGTFPVYSPQSGDRLADVARCDAGDVESAVAAARAAQPAWAATPLIERVKIMRQIHALFAARAEEVAQVLILEIGKTVAEAREEVHEYAAPSWQKAGEEVLRHRGQSFPSTQEHTNNKRLVLTHRPLGVVGVITPYNFPTDISSIALAHVIAAGNTVVWKPSEFSPLCCNMVAEMRGVSCCRACQRRPRPRRRKRTSSSTRSRRVVLPAPPRPAGSSLSRLHCARTCSSLGGDGPSSCWLTRTSTPLSGAMNACFYYAGQVCTRASACWCTRTHDGSSLLKARRPTADRRSWRQAIDMGLLRNEATRNRVIAMEDA
jgi:succinate-semialdehyde dehydrogenase/glutarate-semialdehyde dehydrogenase